MKTVAVFNDPSSSKIRKVDFFRKVALDCFNLLVGIELQEAVLVIVAVRCLDEEESVRET